MITTRLANAKNPHQGSTRKVLCVCATGLLRSPTLANYLCRTYKWNCRAVGYDPDYALIVLDEVLVRWADEIWCCDADAYDEVNKYFRGKMIPHTIRLFDMEDVHDYEAPELIEYIRNEIGRRHERIFSGLAHTGVEPWSL